MHTFLTSIVSNLYTFLSDINDKTPESQQRADISTELEIGKNCLVIVINRLFN